MRLTNAIRKHGVVGTVKKASELALKKSGWYKFKFKLKNVDSYNNPTDEELVLIEQELLCRSRFATCSATFNNIDLISRYQLRH
jgi:hypothetical protein